LPNFKIMETPFNTRVKMFCRIKKILMKDVLVLFLGFLVAIVVLL